MPPSPSGPDAPPHLTDGQRRHLASVLAQLRGAVDELEALAGLAAAPVGPSERLAADLSPGFEREAPPRIARLRASLAALTERFGLAYPPASACRRARALLMGALVGLEDSDERRLRAYGATDPALARTLDPILDEIRTELLALAAALEPDGR